MVQTSGCQHVALDQSKIAGDVRVYVFRENGRVTHRVHTVLVDVRVKTGKIHVLDFCGRVRFCLHQQFHGIDPTPVKRVSRIQRVYNILQTVHVLFGLRVPLKKIAKLAFPHFHHLPISLFQEHRFHLRPFVQFVHGQTADRVELVCGKALGTTVVKTPVKLVGGACFLATPIQKVRSLASLSDIATVLNVHTLFVCHIRQPTIGYRRLFGFLPIPHVRDDCYGILLQKHGAEYQIAQGSDGDTTFKRVDLAQTFTVWAKFRQQCLKMSTSNRQYLSSSSSMLKTFSRWVSYHL